MRFCFHLDLGAEVSGWRYSTMHNTLNFIKYVQNCAHSALTRGNVGLSRTLGIRTTVLPRSQVSWAGTVMAGLSSLPQWLFLHSFGPFLLQLEIALLVSYLFVVFKNCIIVRVIFFPGYFILVGGGQCYNLEEKQIKLFRLSPSLSRVNYNPHLLFFNC